MGVAGGGGGAGGRGRRRVSETARGVGVSGAAHRGGGRGVAQGWCEQRRPLQCYGGHSPWDGCDTWRIRCWREAGGLAQVV